MRPVGDSSVTPLFGRSSSVPARPYLYSIDIDGTLMKWKTLNTQPEEALVAKNASFLQKARQKAYILLNTARGLKEIQAIAPFLKNIPVDYLGLNNGQQLYINRNHKRADLWIKDLQDRKQSASWRRIVKKIANGWDLTTVMETIHSTLARVGFTPASREDSPYHYAAVSKVDEKSGDKVVVTALQTEPIFYVTHCGNPLTPTHHDYGKTLASAMETVLRDEKHYNLQCKAGVSERAGSANVSYRFLPIGINKASLVAHVLKRLPSVNAVISAGDKGDYDEEMLVRQEYKGANGRLIPNYGILSGKDEKLLGRLRHFQQTIGKPFEQTPEGDLAAGFEKLHARIDAAGATAIA